MTSIAATKLIIMLCVKTHKREVIGGTSEGFEKSTTILILTIGLLGFVGNIVTIIKISRDKRFHTPTYLAIRCLALPDTLNIITFILILIAMIMMIMEDSFDRIKTISYTLSFLSIFQGLIAISAIIIIHIKKVKALRMSSVTNTIRRRMNVIICIILSIYIFSRIPLLLFMCYSFYVLFTGNLFSVIFNMYIYNTSLLFGILNFSCNPYIIFLAS
ncbi:melanocyte-stimulating hormone receptor-like, partial [Saccostrea cucullata]|uniref:melanocyte-stimulating hormone receptor-like n=1 Tax=Saccostrea cuccullata TaxID=36930 RepID=UPI002ED311E0